MTTTCGVSFAADNPASVSDCMFRAADVETARKMAERRAIDTGSDQIVVTPDDWFIVAAPTTES